MTDTLHIAGAAIPEPSVVTAISQDRLHVPVYPEHMDGTRRVSLLEYLGINKEDQQVSAQGVTLGRQPRPYDFDAILNFKTSNVHHSACINAKVTSTVGQGFLTDKDKERRAAVAAGTPSAMIPFSTGISKASKLLDPICTNTFQHVLTNVAEDFFQLANGYIEVVRGGTDGRITGIHHLPARDVWVYVEDNNYNFHYEIQSAQGPMNNRRFARFGDKGRLHFPHEGYVAANGTWTQRRNACRRAGCQ
jgi:capsid portal protein